MFDVIRVPGVDEGMLSPAYWLEQENAADEVLLTQEEIAHLHTVWRTSTPSMADWPSVCAQSPSTETMDLWMQEDLHTCAQLRQREPLYYASGEAVANEDWLRWESIAREALCARSDGQAQAYAFTVSRADMRTMPVAEAIYFAGDAPRYDRFQETALAIWTPLVLLAQTHDGRFVYAQAPNYRGWLATSSVATASARDFTDWQRRLASDARDLLVTRDPYTIVQSQKRAQRLTFATRAPILHDPGHHSNRVQIALPVRGAHGELQVSPADVVSEASVSRGVLPCTRRHLVTHAFALLGEPYGWGDECNRHDCSSLLMAVCSTAGVDLPRNAGDQEQVPGLVTWRFDAQASVEKRADVLRQLRPGDLLYMPGHAMMYLGMRQGRTYILHDFSGYCTRGPDGALVYSSVHQVTVSPLDILLSSGKSYGEALTTALRLHASP